MRQKFMKFVSLNMLGMMGLSIYILADTFFIAAKLGTLGIAALNFGISVYCIIHGFGLMLGIGGATRFAISKGQKKLQEANQALSHTMVLAIIVAGVFVTIGLFGNHSLVNILGADSEVHQMAYIYIRTILLFSPCYITNNILLAFTRNDNNPRIAMIAMLTSSMSNIVLDYIFMYPLSMGIFGAVLATGLSPIISMCVLFVHIRSDKRTYRIEKCRIQVKKLFDIMSLGLSAFVGEMTSAVALITFNITILKIAGNAGVAAYGVIANIALVVNALFVGVAQGIQPLTSESYGNQEVKNLSKILKYSVVTIVGIAVLSYVVVAMNDDWIVSAFNSEGDRELQILALEGMKLYFIGYFFAGFNIVLAAYFSAVEKPAYAFVTSLLRSLVILVPLCLILSSFLGMVGVWSSFVVTEFLVMLLMGVFLTVEKGIVVISNNKL